MTKCYLFKKLSVLTNNNQAPRNRLHRHSNIKIIIIYDNKTLYYSKSLLKMTSYLVFSD